MQEYAMTHVVWDGKVLRSNLDRDADYPDVFNDISQSVKGSSGIVPLLMHDHFSLNPSQFIYYPTFQLYIV